MATGFVWHERYMWHDTGRASGRSSPPAGWLEPEAPRGEPGDEAALPQPARRQRAARPDSCRSAAPGDASTELCRFHTAEYVERIRAMSAAGGGDGGELAAVRPGRLRDRAALGRRRDRRRRRGARRRRRQRLRARAPARPPRRARRGRGLLHVRQHRRRRPPRARGARASSGSRSSTGTSTTATAPGRLLRRPDRADDLAAPGQLFPADSGIVERDGEGAGAGYNVNVPLPPGSGDGAYVAAFERVVVPALERFGPELIIVASRPRREHDGPARRMMIVTSEGYRPADARSWSTPPTGSATAVSSSIHEGGYSSALRPVLRPGGRRGAVGHRDRRARHVPPGVPGRHGLAWTLQPHQEALIDRVVQLVPAIA